MGPPHTPGYTPTAALRPRTGVPPPGSTGAAAPPRPRGRGVLFARGGIQVDCGDNWVPDVTAEGFVAQARRQVRAGAAGGGMAAIEECRGMSGSTAAPGTRSPGPRPPTPRKHSCATGRRRPGRAGNYLHEAEPTGLQT